MGGLESTLSDLDAILDNCMALQSCVGQFPILENVRDDDIRQIAVIVKGQRIETPVHGPVKVDMLILLVRIGLDNHAPGGAALLQLQPKNGHQLFKFSFQVFRPGIGHVRAAFIRGFTIRAFPGNVPLHLQHDLTRHLRADHGREVHGLHLALFQPPCLIPVELIPQIEGVGHVGGQGRFNPLHRFYISVGNHAPKHLPYHRH